MDDPLGPIAADDPRHTGVRRCRACPDDAAQFVAALGLHHHVHILPGHKTGAEGNGQRSHIPRGAEIFLSNDGIHQHGRLCRSQAAALWVHQNRNGVLRPDGVGFGQRSHPHGPQALHGGLALIDGLAQGHLTADGSGVFCFQHQHPQPGRPEPVDGAGGKVSAAPHHDPFFLFHRSFLRFDPL